MKKIEVTKGVFAIVDDEDFPYLNRFNWTNDNGNPAREISGRTILMVNFIVQLPQGRFRYFFKNRNSFDLRKKNIDTRTFSETTIGYPKTSRKCSSIYKGVSLDKRSRLWVSYIYLPSKTVKGIRNKQHIYIGRFDNEIDAAKAYNKKVVELYGRFAYQNKIE